MLKNIFTAGLTTSQARERIRRYGHNEFTPPADFSLLKLFLSQFSSPLIYVLVIAGLVSLFLRDYADAVIIFSAVILNAALAFYQEIRAHKTLAALKSLIQSKVKVMRDGRCTEIDSRLVVPGDLVILTLGTKIPADGLLVEATDFTVNEAVLTGESVPVDKICASDLSKPPKSSLVYAATTVVAGIAKMLVLTTGSETMVGKIGEKISETVEEKTPLKIQIEKTAKYLVIAISLITTIVFCAGMVRGYGLLNMFTVGIALGVAAIPEGLGVTLTIILALGMKRLAKRKAVIRKLMAAETLGGVTVICVDKTGTLTEGKMKVVQNDFTDDALGIKASILCNDLRDPLEMSMWDWAVGKLRQKKKMPEALKAEMPRLDEVPFSHKTKLIATLHPGLLLISGAPETILDHSSLDRASQDHWNNKFEDYGQQAYRLVAFAYKKVEKTKKKITDKDLYGCRWLGVLVYEDPVRQGVKEALAACQRAGIEVKVITGDYPTTTEAVARKLGLEGKLMLGEELDKYSDGILSQKIKETTLFARTTPEQKFKIVEALKQMGESVAMTGDGVNDAPALQKADIGIVVGQASDVARETADMVLLDNDFSTIVQAIGEGRNIAHNLRKVIQYLLSHSFTEIVVIGGSIILGLPLPLTAGQILWINLMEDSLPATALAFEKQEKGLLERKADPVTLFNTQAKLMLSLMVLLNGLFVGGLYYYLNWFGFDLNFSRTMVFVSICLNSLFFIFVNRSLTTPLFRQNPFGNGYLNGTVIFSLLLLLVAIYFEPIRNILGNIVLSAREWKLLFFIGFSNLLLSESIKYLIYRRNDSH